MLCHEHVALPVVILNLAARDGEGKTLIDIVSFDSTDFRRAIVKQRVSIVGELKALAQSVGTSGITGHTPVGRIEETQYFNGHFTGKLNAADS